MDFEQVFPLRFWINLGRREDRRLETQARLEEAGISAERFAGVDARAIEKRKPRLKSSSAPGLRLVATPAARRTGIAPEPFSKEFRGYETAGRYALALTQRLAIREASRRGAPSVLLFEDDVVFHPNFKTLFQTVEVPDDWGIFYIGCTHNQPPEWAGCRVVRVKWGVDTHAIAIRSTYYRQALEILDRFTKPDIGIAKASDQFLALLHEKIPTYACYPNLAWQDISGSDLIGEQYSSYHDDGLQRNWGHAVSKLLPELVGEPKEEAEPPQPEEGLQTSLVGTKDSTTPESWSRPIVRRRARLGLLFLTRGDSHHPEIWQEFMEECPDSVRIFSHPKNPSQIRGGLLEGTMIRARFATEWGGIGLVQASRALLLEALADDSLTHFVLLSESCVPVKPLRHIIRRLTLDPRPQFEFRKMNDANARYRPRAASVPMVPEGCWRFQSQWWLMDRVTAHIAAGQDFTQMFRDIFAPDEAYFATVLSMQGYPLDGNILRSDVTWTWWVEGEKSPKSWDKLPETMAQDIMQSGALFARKFPIGADVGKYGLHRSSY